MQDAAQKVNDTYLKAFSEESGVQSCCEAADLLIAWYLENNGLTNPAGFAIIIPLMDS